MKQYILDTNTVSHLLRQHPQVSAKILTVPISALCISAITEGELLFGLAKRPDAKRLRLAVHEFLLRMDVLPWDHNVSKHYAIMRAELEKQGKPLAPLDLLIAAHAISRDAILVTNDQAFQHIAKLQLEDWTASLA